MTHPRRVAVCSGTFDPPAVHHRQIAATLAGRFDEVVIVPSGTRPDRPAAESLPIHRAILADLNFRGLERVRVDLADLERNRFTPNHEFERQLGGPGVVVSHVVPRGVVDRGEDGRSRVESEWAEGAWMWRHAHFTVLHEPGEPVDADLLPPHGEALEVPPHATTALIRSHLYDGFPTDGLLHPPVERYVRRHGLFQATPPARECLLQMAEPRFRLVFDERNPNASALAEQLRPFQSEEPEAIVAIGGDGTMLRAIRQHWRERLPFYGVNTGQLGFLLNSRSSAPFWERPLRLHQLPLLWVELSTWEGRHVESLAFNDCWVERDTGQTAWLEVSVNGQVRMPRVVCDGMLAATAAGSTSYARAMGATPLPFNAGLLTLAGSNVLKPEFWHPAVLTSDSVVTFKNLDPVKRPIRGYVDGVELGRVQAMTARVSNIAAVELLFDPAHDPVAKLALLQFPQPGPG